MIDSQEALEIAKEVSKEIAKNAYNDVGKPIAKPTGELVGLVPRAIKAALAPLEKWILQREYNVAKTKEILEKKLQNTPPELIEPPEAHIAVPAMQYISYCMDNEELREMYANLLANSMNKVVKNGVHPGFVEIIKQLCPDEAKFLRYMMNNKIIPTLSLKYQKSDGSGITIVKDFSNVPKLSGCEHINDSEKYIDNLVRLGLLKRSELAHLTNKSVYQPLKDDPYISQLNKDELAKQYGFEKCSFGEEYAEITAFGKSFCDICLNTKRVAIVQHQN